MKNKKTKDKSGVALVSVMCFLFMTAALVAILMKASVSNFMMSGAAVDLEIALNLAEGGMERAVDHIASNGETPITLRGQMGNGRYETTIIASDDNGNAFNGEHILSGEINLNPNNNSDNEFNMLLENGTTLSRDSLGKDFPGFSGDVTYIHFKPKGNGNQNSLIIDGAQYELRNSETYDVTAPVMTVNLYNDHVVNGSANGQWWLSINGVDVNFSSSAGDMDTMPRAKSFSIISVGTFGRQQRRVTMTGLRNMSWAQFALWSHNNRNIYFKDGEEFYGPVHANSKLWFSGDPHFYDKVTSSDDSYGGTIDDVIFDKGFELEVPVDTMADIPFDELHDEARSGGAENRVIPEDCWIVLDDDDIQIGTMQDVEETYIDIHGHERTRTVTQIVYDTVEHATEELIYVEGDMHIQGVLDGRRTFVSEGNIYIDDSITYTSDPKANPASDDGLGLLTKRDIVVTADAPNNLNIYAHMMATGAGTASDTDGSFRVEDYDSGNSRGDLIVHGGIVQHYRGAVGTFNTNTGQTTTGFKKAYTFDSRFAINPPPHYPTLADQYTFDNWSEGNP